MYRTILPNLVMTFIVLAVVVLADATEASSGVGSPGLDGMATMAPDDNGDGQLIPSSVYQLTVTVVGGNGTVEPNSGSYPEGTVVELTATPDEDYCLKEWTNTDNDLCYRLTNTVTMTENITVLVEFRMPTIIPVMGSLQDAIDVAENGDKLIVSAGLYHENISFNGKNIAVMSMNPDDPSVVSQTVIQGTGAGAVVTFSGCEDASCILLGLTITGGNTTGNGGGICGNSTEATISNCVITGNHADGAGGGLSDCSGLIAWCSITDNSAEYGGGISCYGAPTIANCTISNNSAEGGGGVYSFEGGPKVVNCIIVDNTANDSGGGVYLGGVASPELRNCLIAANTAGTDGGGIICSWFVAPTVSNCTVVENTATSGNGGGLYCTYGSSAVASNNIFWGNSGIAGPQVGISGGELSYLSMPSTLAISYSNIEGGVAAVHIEGESTLNWDMGNIATDPCFADTSSAEPNEWDYHLLPDSPCIDSGDNNNVPPDGADLDGDGNTTEPTPFDLDGNARIVDGNNDGNAVVDMGAYEYSIPPLIEVAMNFTPQALNPNSKGNWMKAHFVLPEGYAVGDVDCNTPALVQAGNIESDHMNVFVNDDGLVEIEAAFDRAEFCSIVTGGEPMEVRVVGSLTSGQQFYGTDTIKITTNYLKYLGTLASHWLEESCSKPDWCGGFDNNRDGMVNFVDFAIFANNWLWEE